MPARETGDGLWVDIRWRDGTEPSIPTKLGLLPPNKGLHLKWMGGLEKNPPCKGAYKQTCLFRLWFGREGEECYLRIYNHILGCIRQRENKQKNKETQAEKLT